jgi:hypothetical protein
MSIFFGNLFNCFYWHQELALLLQQGSFFTCRGMGGEHKYPYFMMSEECYNFGVLLVLSSTTLRTLPIIFLKNGYCCLYQRRYISLL